MSSLLGSNEDKDNKVNKLLSKKEKKKEKKKSDKKSKKNSNSNKTSKYQTVKLNSNSEFYAKDFFDENIKNNYLMIENCAYNLRQSGCGSGGKTNKIMNMVLKEPYNLEYYSLSQ